MGHREDDMPAIVHRPTRLWHPDYGGGGLAGGAPGRRFELVLWIIRATVASAPRNALPWPYAGADWASEPDGDDGYTFLPAGEALGRVAARTTAPRIAAAIRARREGCPAYLEGSR
jgi:hypothetical protein